jgi:hypothetical protein
MPSSILPSAWQIPEAIRKRLGSRVGRQRAMFHDGHLLLVLHAPPVADETAREGRFFWRDPDGNWKSKELGRGIQALNTHVEQYEKAISRLDELEANATGSDQYFAVLEQLAPVHRAARHLYQVLQEARKLCPDDSDIINARDHAYAIERNAELLYGEAKNALDFEVVKRVEEQAESNRYMEVTAHRLNMLVAFFFPVATLTAIFGVNLEHGYEHQHAPYLFVGTIGVGLLLGLFLTAFVGRRHRKGPRAASSRR